MRTNPIKIMEIPKGYFLHKGKLYKHGGPGSGFKGHSGRPGQVGGSEDEDVLEGIDKDTRMTIINKVEETVRRRGATVKKIDIVHLPKKWGEYNPKTKTITLSDDIVSLSEELQEYVILHEVMHIDYPNHGPLFQMVMSAEMPDWKQRDSELPKTKVI